MAQVFGTEISEYRLVKFWRTSTLVEVPYFVRAFIAAIKGRYEALEATREVANAMANDWDDALHKVVTDYDIFDKIAIDAGIRVNSWFDLVIQRIAENSDKEFEKLIYMFHIGNISFSELLSCMIEKYIPESDFNKFIEAEEWADIADILED